MYNNYYGICSIYCNVMYSRNMLQFPMFSESDSKYWLVFIFRRLKINHDSHDFIFESGTVANNKYLYKVFGFFKKKECRVLKQFLLVSTILCLVKVFDQMKNNKGKWRISVTLDDFWLFWNRAISLMLKNSKTVWNTTFNWAILIQNLINKKCNVKISYNLPRIICTFKTRNMFFVFRGRLVRSEQQLLCYK